MPLPVRLHAIAFVPAVLLAIGGFVFAPSGPRSGDAAELVIKVTIGLAIAIYWGVRKYLESQLFEDGAKIVIDAQAVMLPGFLQGTYGTIRLTRQQIVKILVHHPKDRGDSDLNSTLTLVTTDQGKLTFWGSAIEADLDTVALMMERYLLKPISYEDPGSVEFPWWSLPLFIGGLVLFCWIVYQLV